MTSQYFERGAASPDSSGRSPFAFSIRSDVSQIRIAQTLDELLQAKVTQTVEFALRQSLSEMIFEAEESTARLYVVRTAVLDRNTCKVCAALNGVLFREGSPEQEANTPPYAAAGPAPHVCLGYLAGHKCRCVFDPAVPGRTGLEISGEIIESSAERVLGALRISGHGDAELSTPRLAAIAKTRKRLTEEDEPFRARNQIREDEAERIIRRVLITGRPALTRNVISALGYLANTGFVPPESFRDPRELVQL